MRVGRRLVVLAMVALCVLVLGALAKDEPNEEGMHTPSFVIGGSTGGDGESITLVQELAWEGAVDYDNLVSPSFSGVAKSSPNQAIWSVSSNRNLTLQVRASAPAGVDLNKKLKAQFYVVFYPDAGTTANMVVVDNWSTLKSSEFKSSDVDLADYDIGDTGCKIVLEAGVERKGLKDKADTYQMILTLLVSGGGL